jgi:hypothetical protein
MPAGWLGVHPKPPTPSSPFLKGQFSGVVAATLKHLTLPLNRKLKLSTGATIYRIFKTIMIWYSQVSCISKTYFPPGYIFAHHVVILPCSPPIWSRGDLLKVSGLQTLFFNAKHYPVL